MLATLGGALPSQGVAGPAAPVPPQSSVDCEEWQQHHEGADATGGPCGESPAFRAEEYLSDLSRKEEKGWFRWQPLEPTGRDLSLWYYPGAPRPLWGY